LIITQKRSWPKEERRRGEKIDQKKLGLSVMDIILSQTPLKAQEEFLAIFSKNAPGEGLTRCP
jgi:hypothetical protein